MEPEGMPHWQQPDSATLSAATQYASEPQGQDLWAAFDPHPQEDPYPHLRSHNPQTHPSQTHPSQTHPQTHPMQTHLTQTHPQVHIQLRQPQGPPSRDPSRDPRDPSRDPRDPSRDPSRDPYLDAFPDPYPASSDPSPGGPNYTQHPRIVFRGAASSHSSPHQGQHVQHGQHGQLPKPTHFRRGMQKARSESSPSLRPQQRAQRPPLVPSSPSGAPPELRQDGLWDFQSAFGEMPPPSDYMVRMGSMSSLAPSGVQVRVNPCV